MTIGKQDAEVLADLTGSGYGPRMDFQETIEEVPDLFKTEHFLPIKITASTEMRP